MMNLSMKDLSALKTKSQISKYKACELIEKNPKKYKDGSQVLDEIENDAKRFQENSQRVITHWKEFSPRAARAITVDLK